MSACIEINDHNHILSVVTPKGDLDLEPSSHTYGKAQFTTYLNKHYRSPSLAIAG